MCTIYVKGDSMFKPRANYFFGLFAAVWIRRACESTDKVLENNSYTFPYDKCMTHNTHGQTGAKLV